VTTGRGPVAASGTQRATRHAWSRTSEPARMKGCRRWCGPLWCVQMPERGSKPAGFDPRSGKGVVRRRPTLPPRLRGSTIGAERLSFRVRNGTGRFPLAMAAVTRVNVDHPRSGVGAFRTAQWTRVVQRWCSGLCLVGRLVWSTAWLGRPPRCVGDGVIVWSSPRPVSTGRLAHLAVLPPPAYQPAGLGGGLTRLIPVRDLILKRASRLDAFSGYPCRT
jgi:hypothetical protein